MKFGGSSVADTEKITEVARRLVRAREQGRRVVGVLSAMGDTTDELIRLAHEISPRPHLREYDMLVSVGERISNALCAMAIHDLGHEAISLTGSQAGIITDTSHGKAKIVEVRAARINDAMDDGRIVLVAGFQGVSSEHEVTTLGRGGPGLGGGVSGAPGAGGENFDMTGQNRRAAGPTDTPSPPQKRDLPAAEPTLEGLREEIGARGIAYDPDVAKVSLIGAGM